MNISEMTAHLLQGHGVATVVTSPGSRNAPVITAMTRCKGLKTISLVDERAAGFVALGIAQTTGKPVALVCTSGSAVLNYAPALAEAYYRRVPLIVISADRPAQWIDQNDSQTIRQNGAVSAVVAHTVDISDDKQTECGWYANRQVNEAILTALRNQRPVHINLHIDFRNCPDTDFVPRLIEEVNTEGYLPTCVVRGMASPLLSPAKVMIVVGFMPPNDKLSRAMARLANKPNVVVIAEALSNLHGQNIISSPDSLLKAEVPSDLIPDIVISTGGAVVSATLKRFLRRLPLTVSVWHVGCEDNIIDCYQHLTKIVNINPIQFFGQLSSAINKPGQPTSDYASKWQSRVESIDRTSKHEGCTGDILNYIVANIPSRWNVQSSNGTTIRFLQLCNCQNLHRLDCNRGVSGIDGSTMTALGASWAYTKDSTLLITGDMSLSYDMGWLTSPLLTPRFKVIVLNNNGGNIFRMAKSTKGLPERETHFAIADQPSLLPLASAAGWSVFEAYDHNSLADNFSRFISEDSAPAILMVYTSAKLDSEILTQYL